MVLRTRWYWIRAFGRWTAEWQTWSGKSIWSALVNPPKTKQSEFKADSRPSHWQLRRKKIVVVQNPCRALIFVVPPPPNGRPHSAELLADSSRRTETQLKWAPPTMLKRP